MFKDRKDAGMSKDINLTYFIMLIVVATFVDHKYVSSYIKPYKIVYSRWIYNV